MRQKDVAVIGVPFSGGQTKVGVQDGPQFLRDGGLITNLENLGRKVTDYGDIPIPEYSTEDPEISYHNGYMLKNAKACGLVSERVANEVEKHANNNEVCVTIGGDHSIATGTVIGMKRAYPDACVIWVDAHNDLNTYETSPSGNIHGMCLSYVLNGLRPNTVHGYEWAKACLNPFDIVYIGLRDTDPGEYDLAQKLGIISFSMYHVDKYGIATVIERAIEVVNPRRNRPIHLSFDIDSLDPIHTPSTGTAVPGGLSLREGLFIGEYVNKTGLLAGLDIVEVNPKLGTTDYERTLTLNTAIRLTEACLGKHRAGYIAT